MSISFACSHCQSKMTVPDHLAGKKGRCSKCKNPIVVPGVAEAPEPATAAVTKRPGAPPASPTVPPVPPPPVPPVPEPVDIEAAAAELFADPVEQEQELATVEFNCPMCDEPISMPIAEAGKRAPCPECTRIILVPVPQKQKEKNWRDTGPKLPAAAKRDLGPELEGAWGTDKAVGPSQEALVEAGVIKERERPLTFYQKYQMHMLVGIPLLFFTGLGYLAWSWYAANREARAYNSAVAFVRSEAGKKLSPSAQAALNLQATRYQLRSLANGSATRARDLLNAALASLRSARGPTRDLLLADLAAIALQAGGDEIEISRDTRLKRDESQKLARQALLLVEHPEARVLAVRQAVRELMRQQLPERATILAAQVAGSEAERADFLAVAGLELQRRGQTEAATKAAQEAEAVYTSTPAGEKDKAKTAVPPLRAHVVSLAVLLERKPPAPGNDLAERDAALYGRVAGLAEAGKLEEARQAVATADTNAAKLVAWIRLVDAVGQASESDLKATMAALSAVDTRGLEWELLRLVRASVRSGSKSEDVQAVIAKMSPREMQDWGRLTSLRTRAETSQYALDLADAEKLSASSTVGLLARLEVAWQNTWADKGWASTIDSWDETPRAFGSLGVALGLQGGRER